MDIQSELRPHKTTEDKNTTELAYLYIYFVVKRGTTMADTKLAYGCDVM